MRKKAPKKLITPLNIPREKDKAMQWLKDRQAMRENWWVDDWCVCDLHRLLNSSHGTRTGQYVYFVSNLAGNKPIYIGMTTKGVKLRLLDHIKAESRLGELIKDPLIKNLEGHWSCDIFIVRGALRLAENYCIQTYGPVLNIMRSGEFRPPTNPLPSPRHVWFKTNRDRERDFIAELDRRIERVYGKSHTSIANELYPKATVQESLLSGSAPPLFVERSPFRDPHHPDLRSSSADTADAKHPRNPQEDA